MCWSIYIIILKCLHGILGVTFTFNVLKVWYDDILDPLAIPKLG